MRKLEQSQYNDLKNLKEKQFIQLKHMIYYAYSQTDYYRKKLDAAGINPGDIMNLNDFEKFPILTKRDIQENQDQLIARGYSRESLIPFRTGGSTGKSLEVFWDSYSLEKLVGSALRSFRWAGWEIGEGWGRVWGNPPQCRSVKEKLLNALVHPQIFLDTMNLNERTVFEFAENWKRTKPTLLHGHSHSLYILAQFCKTLSIADIRPKGIISTSMMLIPSERRVIESVFGCKATDLYGCEEVGLIASECEEHKGMHINMECNYVEFISSEGHNVGSGENGAILVSSLMNKAMPLIRYNIEDMGIPSQETCRCGRTLPLLKGVTGRVADFLVRKDGSLVAGVSLVERTLTAFPGIDQMQVIQKDLDNIILNIVRKDSYSDETEHYLIREFKETIGIDVNVHLNFVRSITQDQNGKYRFAISKVSNPFQL